MLPVLWTGLSTPDGWTAIRGGSELNVAWSRTVMISGDVQPGSDPGSRLNWFFRPAVAVVRWMGGPKVIWISIRVGIGHPPERWKIGGPHASFGATMGKVFLGDHLNFRLGRKATSNGLSRTRSDYAVLSELFTVWLSVRGAPIRSAPNRQGQVL